MATSYDPGLGSDRDWVRFLCGDRGPDQGGSRWHLENEEIQALLTEELHAVGRAGPWLRYFAAARAIEQMAQTWHAAGAGIAEKYVGELRIRRDSGGALQDAIARRAQELRQQGAWLLTPRPRFFRAL
jgi:hypothetical protein